jgi:AcrR family transcriptional regulator
MPNSKQLLIDAAVELLARNPGAPLAEIAEAAGVKRVTLHRHFGNRESLLREVALTCLDEMDRAGKLAAKGSKSYTEALKAIVAALVPVGDRFHFLWNQQNHELWKDRKLKKRLLKEDKELSGLVEKAKKEGSIDSSIPTAWVISSIDAIIFAASESIISGAIAANDASELAIRTLFQGMGPSKRSRN